MTARVAAPLAALLLAGCLALPEASSTSATADLRDAQGRPVGRAYLTEVPGGVRVLVETEGLPPGRKAVHIHEVGDCRPPDYDSTGGHFNPSRARHGLLNPAGPHAGDLPNMVVGEDGRGRMETTTDRVALGPVAGSLFDVDGSAIVVHAGPDDHVTDPAGGSGPRIACGVIVRR